MKNLKIIRISQKLTQEELAAKSGIARGVIIALESGADAKVSTALKIASALNVTLDQLYGLAEVKF